MTQKYKQENNIHMCSIDRITVYKQIHTSEKRKYKLNEIWETKFRIRDVILLPVKGMLFFE